MRLPLAAFQLALIALWQAPRAVSAFSCEVSASGIEYDLRPLAGPRTAVRESDTPPTKSEARATLDLCGDGLPWEDGVADEDQVSPFRKVSEACEHENELTLGSVRKARRCACGW